MSVMSYEPLTPAVAVMAIVAPSSVSCQMPSIASQAFESMTCLKLSTAVVVCAERLNVAMAKAMKVVSRTEAFIRL